jgi:aryl-alcohol dehydrogenase-like predicted oxidoreductase
MKTRTLADTGLVVSAIGLGGMPLSLRRRPDPAAGEAVIHAALDVGVTFIDTADVYCVDDADIGHNERLISGALAKRGRLKGDDRVIVATKGGLERPGGSWRTNGRPEHLREACERSLTALGVEVIDIYQLHAPDDDVPFAESVGEMASLREAGKVRHVGISNVTVEEIELARSIVPIVSVQNRCNLFDTKSFDNGVAAYCHVNGIAFLPHSPVGGHMGHDRTRQHRALAEIAASVGASSYEVMIAWLLSWSPTMIPIPGASRAASIQSSARAVEIELDDAARARLDALAGVSRPA